MHHIRHLLIGVVAMLIVLLALQVMLHAQVRPPCYELPNFSKYTAMTPSGLTTTARSHVRVSGEVVAVTREEDGDMHVGMSDGRVSIVAECIPEMPCPAVVKGDHITVYGISRYDKQHKWYEVHPVEKMEVFKATK